MKSRSNKVNDVAQNELKSQIVDIFTTKNIIPFYSVLQPLFWKRNAPTFTIEVGMKQNDPPIQHSFRHCCTKRFTKHMTNMLPFRSDGTRNSEFHSRKKEALNFWNLFADSSTPLALHSNLYPLNENNFLFKISKVRC